MTWRTWAWALPTASTLLSLPCLVSEAAVGTAPTAKSQPNLASVLHTRSLKIGPRARRRRWGCKTFQKATNHRSKEQSFSPHMVLLMDSLAQKTCQLGHNQAPAEIWLHCCLQGRQHPI